MTTACLLVCNDLVPEAQTAFTNWYQQEHLAERLGVPGFRSARRYAAIRASHPWSALYELDSIDVLSSAAYRARLANPTELTRAIMPRFRRMVRCGLELAAETGDGVGGVLDMLVLLRPIEIDTPLISEWMGHPRLERLRLLRAPDASEPSAAGTAEGRLRAAADTAWPAVLLVEWASATGEELPDVHEQAGAAGLPLIDSQGGRYRLLNLRSNP